LSQRNTTQIVQRRVSVVFTYVSEFVKQSFVNFDVCFENITKHIKINVLMRSMIFGICLKNVKNVKINRFMVGQFLDFS